MEQNTGCISEGLGSVPLIYIGKNLEKPIWYFVSVKDGYCRFLHFGFSPLYPYWMAGMNTGKGVIYSVPDRMSPTLCPKEVWDEVKLFVEGKVKYEPVPSKKGRKASVIRSLTERDELPQVIRGTGTSRSEPMRVDDPPKTARSKPSKDLRGSGGSTSRCIGEDAMLPKASESKRRRNISSAGSDGGGHSEAKPTGAETSSSVRQRGRPRKLRGLVVEVASTGVKNSNQQELIPVTKKADLAIATIPILLQEVPVKRGRGRPRKGSLVADVKDKTNKVKVLEARDSTKRSKKV